MHIVSPRAQLVKSTIAAEVKSPPVSRAAVTMARVSADNRRSRQLP